MSSGEEPVALSGSKRKAEDAKLADSTLSNTKKQNSQERDAMNPKSPLLRIASYDDDELHGNPRGSLFYQSGSPSTAVLESRSLNDNPSNKKVTFDKGTNLHRKTKPHPISHDPSAEFVLKRDEDGDLSLEDDDMISDSNFENDIVDDDEGNQDGSTMNIRGNEVNVTNIKSRVRRNMNVDAVIENVDSVYKKVGIWAVVVWISMSAITYCLAIYTGNMERLVGIEKKAPLVAATLIGTSAVGTILPLFVKGKLQSVSGVICCAIVVHFIAFFTDLAMGCFPTPVFVDPICGVRIYLLRWCEWTPLAFVMTFLTEACRNEKEGKNVQDHIRARRLTTMLRAVQGLEDTSPVRTTSVGDLMEGTRQMNSTQETLYPAYVLAICQGLSTFCGWLFPFCYNIWTWNINMLISCLLYFVMFYRLHHRSKSFATMVEGVTIAEQELYHWSRLSLTLLKTCTAMWTILVVAYFIYTCGPFFYPDSWMNCTGFGMICESIIDVLFKSLYMLIIVDVHDNIFDRSARAERRLEELRQMMGVVWDNSSDVICISVRAANGDVTTMLSPTYLKIYSSSKKADAIAFELEKSCFDEYSRLGDDYDKVRLSSCLKPKTFYHVKFGDLVQRKQHIRGQDFIKDKEIGSMAHLILRAWNAKEDETLLMHELLRSKNTSDKFSIRCEANITRMEQNAILVVVRDISERFRRFEAEKKVISETTARLKDAAANRFTRHEVKNGLLAAIGLCDSLRESIVHDGKVQTDQFNLIKKIVDPNDGCPTDPLNLSRYLFELDKTLHEILDTILAEAMARDVIHEVYEAKLERVDLPKLLYSTMNLTSRSQSMKRFPITTYPDPLPEYAMDIQLLKYIHRNAISNACKYGKRGGQVKTAVTWDKEQGILKMEVINLPGQGHEEILKLGDIANEIVFSPRRRLTMHSMLDSETGESPSHSSGDGAWIMHKCAKTLGGSCGIKFETDKTVFSFQCPVTPYHDMLAMSNVSHEEFVMPNNVWGIALDDSKIQRKLLVRFFLYAGIPEDRIHIKGSSAEDVKNFDNWAVNFVDNHPNDFFLMIIDENLDIQEEQDATRQVTISGSRAISEMRSRLLVDQERRVLALIRSANDSASDVAIYNSRAHGFLPKAPIKKDSVREVLVPMWFKRFPKFESVRSNSAEGSVTIDDSGVEEVITMSDLIPCINDIDKLAALGHDELHEKWSIVWEKLHALKGDLLIMQRHKSIDQAIGMISRLRGPIPPENFFNKWQNIRSTLLMVS